MIYSNDYNVSNSPVISWDDVTNTATLTASSSAADFPVTGLKNGVTTDPWKPDAMPANIEVDCGSTVTASVLSFAAHNMHTSGVTVTLEYYDGASWVELREVVPGSDAPFMISFPRQDAQQWRVSFSGSIFQVAVMSLCDALHIPNQIGPGHTPLYAASEIEILGGSVSSTGEFLQADFFRKGAQVGFEFLAQRPNFILSNEFQNFRDHYNRGRPFFIAMTPLHDPKDVGYVWRNGGNLIPSYQSAAFMDVSLEVGVYVN